MSAHRHRSVVLVMLTTRFVPARQPAPAAVTTRLTPAAPSNGRLMNTSPQRTARRSSVRRRSASAAAVAGLIVAGGATPAASTAEVTTSRVSGPDRYATAAQLSLQAESRPNAAVVLARGDSPFDALSAAGLAGAAL